MPRLVYAGDESAEYASIMNAVNVLTEEMTVKIMIGDQPLDSFDNYVENIRKAGIERATEIVQTALDRQNAQ